MHIHLQIHHWVLWWFGVGIGCVVVALVNSFSRDLTRIQDRVVLAIGVLFWLLGGLVCYASDSVQIEGHIRPCMVRCSQRWESVGICPHHARDSAYGVRHCGAEPVV